MREFHDYVKVGFGIGGVLFLFKPFGRQGASVGGPFMKEDNKWDLFLFNIKL